MSTRQTRVSSPASKWLLATLLICLPLDLLAEILNAGAPMIRLRWGDNTRGSVNTVIYEAGVPDELSALPGLTTEPTTVSTNSVSGGSGVFRVRIVTDLNARNGLTSLTGRFSYDSSQPLQCTTPTTCGGTTIPFTRISWNLRDGDTHTAVTRFDGTATQLAQIQQDSNPANNRDNTRHRNYFQFQFDNIELLPAGTYEGTTTLNGSATP